MTTCVWMRSTHYLVRVQGSRLCIFILSSSCIFHEGPRLIMYDFFAGWITFTHFSQNIWLIFFCNCFSLFQDLILLQLQTFSPNTHTYTVLALCCWYVNCCFENLTVFGFRFEWAGRLIPIQGWSVFIVSQIPILCFFWFALTHAGIYTWCKHVHTHIGTQTQQ